MVIWLSSDFFCAHSFFEKKTAFISAAYQTTLKHFRIYTIVCSVDHNEEVRVCTEAFSRLIFVIWLIFCADFFQRTLGHAETFCMDIKECNADHNEEVRACTEAFSRTVIS